MKVDLRALYQSFTSSALRLETRQHYDVPGDEGRQRAFREGRPLPVRPGKQATLQLIAEAVAAGEQIGRVYVVDRPLTEYVTYELAGAYPENVAAGETVRITDRAAHPDLAGLTRDFVLFDADTDHAVAVFYDYDPDGRLLGYERSDDPVVIADCRRQVELALRHSVALDTFLATMATAG
jgi:hypothetical protein